MNVILGLVMANSIGLSVGLSTLKLPSPDITLRFERADTDVAHNQEKHQEIYMAQAGDSKELRKLKSAVSRTERVISRAERSVEGYEEFKNDRNDAKTLKAIEAAEEGLETISGADEVSDLTRRLEAVVARYESVKSGVESANAGAAESKAALQQLEASGEVDRDANIAGALVESIAQPSVYKFNHAIYGRFGTEEGLEIAVENAQNWDENVKVYESIREKYGNLTQDTSVKVKEIQAHLYRLKDFHPRTVKQMQVFESEAEAELDEALQKAFDIAQEAIDESRFKAFTGLNSEMRMALLKPTAITRIYEALPIVSSREAKSIRKTYENGLEKIEKLKDKARDKIIAENRFDADSYSGSDAAEIKAMAKDGFKAIHGKQDIIEVRIPDRQWTRHTGWRWSKIDKAYHFVDYSTIDAFVFEKTNRKIATYWRVTVQKRHLEGDAIISDPASRHRHKPTPDQQILLENL